MFKQGQLVVITFENRLCTPDGFGTGRLTDDGRFCIFERIELHNYPSCRDFIGKTTYVREGEFATISSYVGRPWKIRPGDEFDYYNVYEILVQGAIRQIFQFNLASGPKPFLI